MNAKLTISRTTSNYENDKPITVSITDSNSGLLITRVNIGLAEFAEALTGHSRLDCETEFVPTEYGVRRFGKYRETKPMFVEKVSLFDNKRNQAHLVEQQATLPDWDGWEVLNNGIGTRQEGEKHKAIMCRYVEETPEPKESER